LYLFITYTFTPIYSRCHFLNRYCLKYGLLATMARCSGILLFEGGTLTPPLKYYRHRNRKQKQ